MDFGMLLYMGARKKGPIQKGRKTSNHAGKQRTLKIKQHHKRRTR